MAAQVAFALRLIDAISAVGVGLVIALLWDLLRLAAGKNKCLLFLCDLLTFLFAAVVLVSFSVSKTYTGQLRWYMEAGALLGFLAYLQLIAPVTKNLWNTVCHLICLPFLILFHRVLTPCARGLKNWGQKQIKSFSCYC